MPPESTTNVYQIATKVAILEEKLAHQSKEFHDLSVKLADYMESMKTYEKQLTDLIYIAERGKGILWLLVGLGTLLNFEKVKEYLSHLIK